MNQVLLIDLVKFTCYHIFMETSTGTVPDKLDSKNMLIPQNLDLNEFKYPTRAYLDMVHYAMERINANATGEVLIAATAIANKHFNDAIELIKIWSKNNTDCDRIKWASGNMDKVNTDEENKKWITKKMKKCGKEQKNSF